MRIIEKFILGLFVSVSMVSQAGTLKKKYVFDLGVQEANLNAVKKTNLELMENKELNSKIISAYTNEKVKDSILKLIQMGKARYQNEQ
jgi:hypothetical protein